MHQAILVIMMALALAAGPAGAQEIIGLGGLAEDTGTRSRDSTWQIEYLEGADEHFAVSFSTLNEGHFPDHNHRDGHTVQLWARTSLLDRQLSLAAGIGPYYYYNTLQDPAGNAELNDHGWGAISTLTATLYTKSRWLFQLRTNWVATRDSIDTLAALVGIGYQLEPPPLPGPLPEAPQQPSNTTANELTAFFGQTTVHNQGSVHSLATSLEYRRGLGRYVDWTVAWLYEGENGLARRQGVVAQLWGARSVLADRLTFSAGVGPFFAVDERSDLQTGQDDRLLVAPVVTISSSFRFHSRWGIRTSWHRVITDYHRDSDVYLGGVGYRF